MELHIFVNGADYTDSVDMAQTRISKELSGRVSTASFTFDVPVNSAKWDESTWDNAVWGVDVQELYRIEAKDESDALQFAGIVTKVSKTWQSEEWIRITAECTDWTVFLERARVPEATFTGQSDRAIIQALIGTYVPELSALTANIAALIPSISEFVVKDQSVREALEDLISLTGGEYRVGYNKAFYYFAPGTYAAPFTLGLPDSREWRLEDFEREFARPINRCTVLGGLLPGGAEISVTYEDPISAATYTLHEHIEVDREITSAADAMLRAQAIVARGAYPNLSGSVVLYDDGLDIGQSLTLAHAPLQASGTYTVRSLELRWLSDTLVEYTATIGDEKPNFERLIRRLSRGRGGSSAVPKAVPVTGSVTDDSIGSGGISVDNLFGTISSGGSVTIDTAVLAGTITAAQGVIVNANAIQGVISGSNVSVATSVLQGVVISSQLADEIIDDLAKMAPSLRPIPNSATEPTLPNANYPVGSFYRNTANGNFYRNDNDTNPWTLVTENEAVSGKLAYHHVGTIKTTNLIGLVLAAQIDSITAGQISGQITASQIASVSASAITGSITAAQIGAVNAAAIQGTITAAQIGSVNAGTVTGSFSHTQIGSVNAATITIGQLADSQIANVSASKLTAGTIDASVITVTNLNASNITSGTLTANRIGAGTITAAVTMTSPSITGGNITITGSGITTTIGDTFGGLRVFAGTAETVVNQNGFVILSGGSVRGSWNIGTFQLYSSGGTVYFGLNAAAGVAPTAGGIVDYLFVTVNGNSRKMALYSV